VPSVNSACNDAVICQAIARERMPCNDGGTEGLLVRMQPMQLDEIDPTTRSASRRPDNMPRAKSLVVMLCARRQHRFSVSDSTLARRLLEDERDPDG
jgi:hypothetical protein